MPFKESTKLATKFGLFVLEYFVGRDGKECVVLHRPSQDDAPIVRIQSACLFGESFHSTECECRRQLEEALELISKKGGYFIYLFQEGRGLGLLTKIRAMNVEKDKGVSTEQALEMLGHPMDPRDYDVAIEAMREAGVPSSIRLLTENKHKILALKKAGFRIVR